MKLNKITPMFTGILTTMDIIKEDIMNNGLLDMDNHAGAVKSIQKVLSVGNVVRSVKEGDYIAINLDRFAIKMHKDGSLKDGVITDNPVIKYNFPIIEVGGKDCLLIDERDIQFIVDSFDEDEPILVN